LVTKGVYSIVRHPLYSGIILAAFDWVLFTLSWPLRPPLAALSSPVL
jgi:protein-S-isoprenylcysteine O-methyltransferase Ste14